MVSWHTHTYKHTRTYIQCTHDGKDMVSEIAQCHFPVHYLLDGAVCKGMNDRSASSYVCVMYVCACEHVFVFAWPCNSSWNERMYFLSCCLHTVCLLACLACENVTAQRFLHKSARLHVCYYIEDVPHQLTLKERACLLPCSLSLSILKAHGANKESVHAKRGQSIKLRQHQMK